MTDAAHAAAAGLPRKLLPSCLPAAGAPRPVWMSLPATEPRRRRWLCPARLLAMSETCRPAPALHPAPLFYLSTAGLALITSSGRAHCTAETRGRHSPGMHAGLCASDRWKFFAPAPGRLPLAIVCPLSGPALALGATLAGRR